MAISDCTEHQAAALVMADLFGREVHDCSDLFADQFRGRVVPGELCGGFDRTQGTEVDVQDKGRCARGFQAFSGFYGAHPDVAGCKVGGFDGGFDVHERQKSRF